MAAVAEPLSRSPAFGSPRGFASHRSKDILILPSSGGPSTSSSATMDTDHTLMGPPLSSPNGDRMNGHTPTGQSEPSQFGADGGASLPVGAAAAAQQPKVVQTAFIHKLYK